MANLSEYMDEYKAHKIRKTIACDPNKHMMKIERKWYDPKKGKDEREKTDEEIQAFIKSVMKCLRGQSTYYNEICAHWDPAFKGPFVPLPKKKKDQTKKEEKEPPVSPPRLKLALKDTEMIRQAHALYTKDMNAPSLEPVNTAARILGYIRPAFFNVGVTEYQGTIARLAYELVRDDRIKRITLDNGKKPRWGYPPEEERQPMLDGAPYDGERLY